MARAPEAWTVRPFAVEGENVHGTAEIDEEGYIEFTETGHITVYDWSVAPDLPYDLAAIRHDVDILGFVKRWGFLHSLEDEDRDPPTVEEFMYESLAMNFMLYRYGLVSGDISSAATKCGIVEYWLGVYSGAMGADLRSWLWHPDKRPIEQGLVDRLLKTGDIEEMALDIREEVQEDLWEQLPSVEVSIQSINRIEWPDDNAPPGPFLLTAYTKELLGRAYLEVALEMTAGTKLGACPEDGRMFAVRDPRQVYCSSQCAGRARYRRFYERRRQPT